MKLKQLPLLSNGCRDFSGVHLSEIFCVEREFALIVGLSPSMVNRLKKYGVLVWTPFDGIFLQQSLREYRLYLPPNKRSALQSRLAANGYDIFL